MLERLFKKQTEIQYIVQDDMLKKQNRIINKLIRISLDNSNINEAAQKMLLMIKECYKIKNFSLFINNNKNLEYLATDLPEEHKNHVGVYVNSVSTDKDVVFFYNEKGSYLSYTSAKQREIVYGVYINLKNMNDILGVLYLELDETNNIRAFEQEIFKTVMESMTIALENLILKDKLMNLSKRDQLTKLYNRTYLEKYIETLESKKYSIAMIDIDFFKKINDTYGHKVGDDVLKYIASVLNKLSSTGEVFRIGGEEFLIISHETKLNLFKLVEDVRKEIEQKDIIEKGMENKARIIKITISSGITDSEDGITFEDVQNRADQELYKVKGAGRNRVSAYKKET